MLKINNFLFIIIFFFLIISIFYSKNFRIDASSDTLILQNDETFKFYQYYNNIFPTKNFLVLAIKSKNKIDNEYIHNIKLLQNKLNNIVGIDSTFSILDAPILLANNINISDLNSEKIENIENSNIELDKILNEFSSSPIFKNQLINKDQNTTSIIMYLTKDKKFKEIKKKRENLKNKNIIMNNKSFENEYRIFKKNYQQKRSNLISEVRKEINKEDTKYQYFLGGIDMISNDTINFVKKDIIIFSLSVLIFINIILFLIFRNFKWVIIPLFTSLYAVISMIGFVGLMNWEITAISSNFISLMFILSISMNIHIINNYRINYFNNKIQRKVFHTLKTMFWPCFYTAITTIVAFGSLLLSDIKPIIDFGNIMIVSLIFIFITSFTILPLIINIFPEMKKGNSIKFNVINNFYYLSIYQSKKIFFINIIIFIISIFGMYKLNVENSFINYFKSNTEIYQGMKIIDSELGGTTPMDILIKFKDEKIINESKTKKEDELEDLLLDDILEIDEDMFNDNIQSWFTEEKIKTLKEIHNYLEERFEVGKVQSLYSLIYVANQINKKNLSAFELSVLYNKIPQNYKNELISPYLSVENNMIKISARIKDSENIKRDILIKETNNYLENHFNNIDEYQVNGLLVLYNNMLQSLFSSQIKSFGFILLSIFSMMLILFKSFKLSVVGIIPNIIASSFILGLIGIMKIPLDIMTITIAAITIGIAVDNTIHYLYKFKENSKIIKDIKDNIKNTHNTVGYAVMTTSLTIAFGFSVLSLSSFIPTILFGIFTALAMIIAMLGVLITLSSCLIKLKK